jgi:hypothetical protein
MNSAFEPISSRLDKTPIYVATAPVSILVTASTNRGFINVDFITTQAGNDQAVRRTWEK